MAGPFATHTDVEARWRPLSSSEILVADTLLVDASSIIRERWTDVDARIASGALSADTLIRIVSQMVKRAMIVGDSEGLESQSQTAGPFGINQTYSNPNGNLYLNADDIAVLNGDGFTRRAKIGWLA